MKDKKYYQKTLDLIPIGRSNAIPMKQLAFLLGVAPRDIRQAILDARLDGVIVCSGMEGYFFPETVDEMLEFLNAHYSRAMTTLASLKGTREKLKELEDMHD